MKAHKSQNTIEPRVIITVAVGITITANTTATSLRMAVEAVTISEVAIITSAAPRIKIIVVKTRVAKTRVAKTLRPITKIKTAVISQKVTNQIAIEIEGEDEGAGAEVKTKLTTKISHRKTTIKAMAVKALTARAMGIKKMVTAIQTTTIVVINLMRRVNRKPTVIRLQIQNSL